MWIHIEIHVLQKRILVKCHLYEQIDFRKAQYVP